jgi:DegV family protein with EDD domain
MTIALVSDSTANISEDFAAEHHVRIVPLYIKIGDVTYRDQVDITPARFYELLPTSTSLPTTSQPSVGDFEAAFRELRDKGATAIISVHLSSGISGTVNSARLASEQMGDMPIEIIDTHSAGAAHMLAVEMGVKAIEAGLGLKESAALVQRVADEQETLFTVDTLEYLYKGGRIGGAAALVGSLLQFKPLLYFRDARIDALERVRKSSRALARMVEVMAERLGSGTPVRAVVMQAAAPERAQEVANMASQQLNVVDLRIQFVTPVLGAHVGNGTIGLCCCPESAYQLPS